MVKSGTHINRIKDKETDVYAQGLTPEMTPTDNMYQEKKKEEESPRLGIL